ncbi:hypothetical protein Peur_039385 [Populus x canadensis]
MHTDRPLHQRRPPPSHTAEQPHLSSLKQRRRRNTQQTDLQREVDLQWRRRERRADL